MSFSLMNFIWIYLEFQIVDFRDSYSIDYTPLYKTQHNNLYETFNTKVKYHEVLDFKDNGIIQLIHQTFRIQFYRVMIHFDD